jgi:hypothetical protein
MKTIGVFAGIILIAGLLSGGYFIWDTWQRTVEIIQQKEAETKHLEVQLDKLKAKTNKTLEEKNKIHLLGMELVEQQIGYALLAKLVEKGLADTILTTISSRRKEKLGKSFSKGLEAIDTRDCPEEFQKLFDDVKKEFKDTDSPLRNKKMKKLKSFINEFSDRHKLKRNHYGMVEF